MKKYLLKILIILLAALSISTLSSMYQTIGLTPALGEQGIACKSAQYYKIHEYACWEVNKTHGFPVQFQHLTGRSSEDYTTNWPNFSLNAAFYFLLLFSISSFYDEMKRIRKGKK